MSAMARETEKLRTVPNPKETGLPMKEAGQLNQIYDWF